MPKYIDSMLPNPEDLLALEPEESAAYSKHLESRLRAFTSLIFAKGQMPLHHVA
jgi:hypothetical protein